MSVNPEVEPVLDEAARQELIETLAEAAEICRPRLFAIHGVYRRRPGTILGWGLEFPDDNRAIFVDPTDSAMHNSNSAQRVLEVMSIIGDVSLTWLDPE